MFKIYAIIFQNHGVQYFMQVNIVLGSFDKECTLKYITIYVSWPNKLVFFATINVKKYTSLLTNLSIEPTNN
jgi:hypothetical protein